MASWQAHLFNLLVRWSIKSRVKSTGSAEHARALLERGRLPSPKGASYTPATLGGVTGEWVKSGRPGRATLMYLHGGAYLACSPQTHRPISSAYALAGFDVFVPDYRLAPEHPFPAAVDDAFAAYTALLRHADGPIVISGESAGGGLCLALMLRLRDRGVALPAAAALFSPWTDLAATGASLKTNKDRDAMLTPNGALMAAAAYLDGADPRTPEASPLYGDLTGLPPILIHVGEREILLDDSTRLADLLRLAKMEVHLRRFPVVAHAWQIAQAFMPEARESLAEASHFLLRHQAASTVSTPTAYMDSLP